MKSDNDTTHEWPARARNFGNHARLGSMSSVAQAEDEAHPYDAYAGFNDPDSGLETDRVLPHAWPPLNRKLAGGLGEQSVDFKAADKRAPRDPKAVATFWNTYQAAKDCGATEQEAKAVGDRAVADIKTYGVAVPLPGFVQRFIDSERAQVGGGQ